MRNPRRVLSKAQILDRVWNYDFGGQANVVELYISYLRKKIDADRAPMIHTMRGAGYVLRPRPLMDENLPQQAAAVGAPPPPADPGGLAPLGRGTLGRRLVIRVTGLVALVAVLLSTATALATRTLLLDSLDSQLDGVSSRAQRADPRGFQGPQGQLLAPAQPPGSLAAAFSDDHSQASGVILAADGILTPAFGRRARSAQPDHRRPRETDRPARRTGPLPGGRARRQHLLQRHSSDTRQRLLGGVGQCGRPTAGATDRARVRADRPGRVGCATRLPSRGAA